MERVCATDRLFHYLLNAADAEAEREVRERVLAGGLRPLSDFPESERWQRIQAMLPGFFELLYRLFAEPVLQRPYTNSGVFLTPIDFRRLPGSLLYARARFAVPLDAVDQAQAVVTWEWEGQRVSRPLSPESLEEAAGLWTADRVREWFGKDQSRLFYYVPQAAVYQDGGIRMRPEWWEPGTAGGAA